MALRATTNQELEITKSNYPFNASPAGSEPEDLTLARIRHLHRQPPHSATAVRPVTDLRCDTLDRSVTYPCSTPPTMADSIIPDLSTAVSFPEGPAGIWQQLFATDQAYHLENRTIAIDPEFMAAWPTRASSIV